MRIKELDNKLNNSNKLKNNHDKVNSDLNEKKLKKQSEVLDLLKNELTLLKKDLKKAYEIMPKFLKNE